MYKIIIEEIEPKTIPKCSLSTETTDTGKAITTIFSKKVELAGLTSSILPENIIICPNRREKNLWY